MARDATATGRQPCPSSRTNVLFGGGDENYAAMHGGGRPWFLPLCLRVSEHRGGEFRPRSIDQIFDPFFHPPRAIGTAGTGLGLSHATGPSSKKPPRFCQPCAARSAAAAPLKFICRRARWLVEIPPPPPSSPVPLRGQGEMILVVDDENGHPGRSLQTTPGCIMATR